MNTQACKMLYVLIPYSISPWDFLSHDNTRSKSPSEFEKKDDTLTGKKKKIHNVAKA